MEIKTKINKWDLMKLKSFAQGFPGGAVVENLPANAGDAGSSPGLGGSHMPRSNSAREPQLLTLRDWSLCSVTRGHDSERPVHRDEESPPLAATGESPHTETKTQHSHTYIHTYINFKKECKQTRISLKYFFKKSFAQQRKP